MHQLFERQLEKARLATGEVNLTVLSELVAGTYAEIDRDRRRTDRAIGEMIREVDAIQARLRDAFDVVPEGLALFDSSDRYVLWNKRYEELHPALAGHLRVGMTFEEALRICLAAGVYVDAAEGEEEWLTSRLERHRSPSNAEEQRCSNGRWLRVEETRTRDGGSIGARIDITELKQREASFRLLFDSNPVPMWIFDVETLSFLSVNDAAVIHYGYTKAQFATMSILDVRPAEEWDATLEAVAGTLERRTMDRLWKHVKADGTPIDVGIFAQPLVWNGRQAILVASIDVTDRKHAEDELARTREFLDAIIENVPTTIFVKEPSEHRYVLLNRAGEMLFGRPREEVIGRRDDELFGEAAGSLTNGLEEELLHGDRDEIAGQESMETPHGGSRVLAVNRLAVRDGTGRTSFLLGVAEDITEKRRAADRIAFLAHHDALTGLPNRAAFMDHLVECLNEAREGDGRFSVFSIDLDRFKSVNDVFGHPVGDVLLREVAGRMLAVAGGAFIARLGGDEFMLICHGDHQPSLSEDLAQRLRSAMSQEFELDGHRIRTGLSIGVAVFPVDGRDAATLLANADAALYRSKAEGRDTIRFFEAEMDKLLRDRRLLQNDLEMALERNELSLYFQPQADMSGEIVGFEALLRWMHPTRGQVSPSVFIPLAEEANLINNISEWVLSEACRIAASWEKPLTVAVNLSPVQFRHGDLPNFIHRILLQSGLAPRRLELEITEGVLIHDFSRAVGVLRRLKAMGIRIAMDDFGTGYSSLSYLQAFPFDKIKIDRSFVANLGRKDQSTAIVRAVIGLCRGLDLPVIAEGVETEEQRDFLSLEQCNEVQGYLIGRPLPIEAYADIVGPRVRSDGSTRTSADRRRRSSR